MQSKIKVIAAILDSHQLILYQEDGSTINIRQGDDRIAPILAQITEPLAKGLHPMVELSHAEKPNEYKEYEKESKGLTRFFRIAKNKLASIFGSKDEESKPVPETGEWGSVPVATQKDDVVTKNLNAVNEIMKHAQPIESESEETTVVAVHNDKVIPNVERISKQFKYANSSKNAKGMTKFLDRISKVIDERGHSVEDLLSFMEKGDLPIADDGSIIIYKALNRSTDENQDGDYCDIHSRKVPQSVGDYVHMDPSLVDHDRRKDCSNGLHVAIRSYLSSFGGSVCVIAKVAPEDVIAVPTGYTNKMRVCGYHIIGELTGLQYSKLKSNLPITDTEDGQILLGKAISGDHTGITRKVKIGAQKGGDIRITYIGKPDPKARKSVSVKVAEPKKAIAIDPENEVTQAAPIVDPKTVSKQVDTTKQEVKQVSSRMEQAMELYANMTDKESAEKLLAFKRKAKVSWEKLGLPDDTLESIQKYTK